MKAINASIEKGTPVNPPIWWVDPTDPVALKEDTGTNTRIHTKSVFKK